MSSCNNAMGFDFLSLIPAAGNTVQRWINGGIPGMMREVNKIKNITGGFNQPAKPAFPDFNNPAHIAIIAGGGLLAVMALRK